MSKALTLSTMIPATLFILLSTGALMAGAGPEFVREKEPIVLEQHAVQYLERHEVDGRAKVWVFFTDKGLLDSRSLAAARRSYDRIISERAKQRRAKHGITEIGFRDLPVRSYYVYRIEKMGATLRHTSKWLNAASFEVELNHLDQIAALPFVAEMRPVALYKNRYDPPAKSTGSQQTPTATGEYSLDYGGSEAQLTQINVPIAHDSGYAGQGVIISVFDTGFRKSHDAFFQAYMMNRVLAEWDFVFNDGNVANEAEDWSSAWNHGTSTWSICGGLWTGTHYGPAYGASFILCKTEDIRSETQVEEDNWVAAVEWTDSIGTDIITSSLSYSDWYTQSDYDGNTCVTTIAADYAAEVGILVCNSAGNAGGPGPSLGAPADADSILTVGAVDYSGAIASFSSRGPTADGRTKPEVCARGVNVHRATSSSDSDFSAWGSGTSYSCPLVAGAAAIVWGANPDWTNMQVREALMMTADNADTPDNTYGWGIIDTWAALNYDFGEGWMPGDADGSGYVNVTDAVWLISYVFADGAPPDPMETGDVDGNGDVNVSDIVYLLNYIFGDGPPPVG
jgi:subtilisin family serine protease